MPGELPELIEAALGGAGQAELLQRALAAGASPYTAPGLVAEALHARDLRAVVLDFARLPDWSSRWHQLRATIIREAAAASGCSRAPAGPERAGKIARHLDRIAGDLPGWSRVRVELLGGGGASEILGGPDRPTDAELERIRDAFGDRPMMATADLLDQLAGHFDARSLAAVLARHGVRPRRLRLPGRTPGTRGYRRSDLPNPAQASRAK